MKQYVDALVVSKALVFQVMENWRGSKPLQRFQIPCSILSGAFTTSCSAGMLGLIASATLKASQAAQWFFGFWQVTPDECRNYFFNAGYAGYNAIRPANALSRFSFGRDYQVHEFAD
jgi:hypothetical protein